MPTIVADATRCVGAGQCVLTDPDAFDQDDDQGLVLILHPTPTSADALSRARQAILLCPSQALSLHE
ncbi:ferredoxin [Catenuloplanes atrovinosus]|nr:ferredoxin [Catenuloplanes atrovinosus]